MHAPPWREACERTLFLPKPCEAGEWLCDGPMERAEARAWVRGAKSERGKNPAQAINKNGLFY